MPMKKERILEACLVISTGLLAFYFIGKRQHIYLVYISLIVGALGVLIRPLAKWIAVFWYKLGDLLGLIVPKIILSAVFYFFLFPIALLYRLSKKDPLRLKDSRKSNWVDREHEYAAGDLKNTW
jgi:hypothetical protein